MTPQTRCLMPPLGDASVQASAACIALQSSSVRNDTELIARFEAQLSSAAAHVTSDVTAFTAALDGCLRSIKPKAERLMRSKDKLLGMKEEELDAGAKTLTSFLHQIAAGDGTLWFTEDTRAAVSLVIRELVGFSNVSAVLTPAHVDALRAVAESSRVVHSVDQARSVVSHTPWCTRGGVNTVSIALFDNCGEPVYGVTRDDVAVTFANESTGWSVFNVTIDAYVISLGVAPTADCTPTASLCAEVGGSSFSTSLTVGSTQLS